MSQSSLFIIAKKMKKANGSFNPIPASIATKRPLGKWKGNSYMMERDFAARERFGNGKSNLGLLVSNDYIVLDIDNKPPSVRGEKRKWSDDSGVKDFEKLCEEHDELPVTLAQNTPSGGKHLYFSKTGKEDEAALKNWSSCMRSADGKLIAVDIRVQGGYVMCAPSCNAHGKKYAWTTEKGYSVPMAPFPNWILKNIMGTVNMEKQHLERQIYSSEPCNNFYIDDEEITAFKQSKYWQDCFRIAPTPDENNIYNITATAPYD
ncbi:hypothetical protein HKX48_002714, partial [Thoreauomyces humboldtii]